LDVTFEPAQHQALHPGQTASIALGDISIGILGALHPSLLKELDLVGPVYVFDLDLNKVETGYLSKFNELSRFPEVRRDIAVVVDREIQASILLDSVKKSAGEYLTNLTLFDVYQGKGIDPQRKSLAIGLTWQHTSRTLTDDEVNALVSQVLAELTSRFNATLRE
jgi:phenylalanyl-tRNA synthetase beta chain